MKILPDDQYVMIATKQGWNPIFEISTFDDEIRFAIIDGVTSAVLSELIQKKREKSLWENGLDKVLDGTTTIEEIIRVVGVPKKN